MHKVLAPVAEVEQDRLARGLQRIRHDFEAVERDLGRADPAHVVAAVVLEHVHAPGGETLGVLRLVVERTLCCASARPVLSPASLMGIVLPNLAHVISPALEYMPNLSPWP